MLGSSALAFAFWLILTQTGPATRTLLDFPADSNASAEWPNNPASTAWLAPDGYHLVAQEPAQFVAVSLHTTECPRDVQVTATFQKTGGPPGGGYAIILRDQEPEQRDGLAQVGRYYVLEVGDLGQVGIWRREGSRWVDVLSWTDSPAVQSGAAPNTLVARAVGSTLSLAVNGQEVLTKNDGLLPSGCTGVFLGGDGNQALLSQLTIEALQ
jgi:hypothetical protein